MNWQFITSRDYKKQINRVCPYTVIPACRKRESPALNNEISAYDLPE